MTNELAMPDIAAAPIPPDVVVFGKLVEAAYTMSGGSLNPPVPPRFPGEYEIVQNVIMDDYGTPTFYGFIARSKAPKTNNFVLVIRGTMDLKEWLIDLESMFPVPFYTFGKVGSGFAATYNTIYLTPRQSGPQIAETAAAAAAVKRPFAAQVADALQAHAARAEAATPDLPAPRLSLVGHSLGSALITLYAVERLVVSSIPIDRFYTFASPLVGDAAFQAAFNALNLPVTYRIFDNWDPVPDLPPLSGYVAVGSPYKIDLSSGYYGWNPLCSHPMATYLNYFDPSYPAASACTTLFWLSQAASTARPARALLLGAAPAAAVVAAAEPAPATTVRKGATTITITIETSDG